MVTQLLPLKLADKKVSHVKRLYVRTLNLNKNHRFQLTLQLLLQLSLFCFEFIYQILGPRISFYHLTKAKKNYRTARRVRATAIK